MFHRYEDEFIKVLRSELAKQGLDLRDEDLGKIRLCVNEIKRRNIPIDKALETAKAIAQVIAERPYRQLTGGEINSLLSRIGSCKLVGYQLRRNETICCPIIVPKGFLAISIIMVSSSPGNISFFIKRIGEPVNTNAYYAEDIVLVGYFDTNGASWVQRLSPGIYLLEVHNYYNESVSVVLDVLTCVIND